MSWMGEKKKVLNCQEEKNRLSLLRERERERGREREETDRERDL